MNYSITFGKHTPEMYPQFTVTANTWDDWHLIPTERPTVVIPQPVTNYVTIPGKAGTLDLSEYLTGYPRLGARSGSFTFYVANDYKNYDWLSVRQKIHNALHGKQLDMCLAENDAEKTNPVYYYTGRFMFDEWKSDASNSTITISYQLDPYKYPIGGSITVDYWDDINFETVEYWPSTKRYKYDTNKHKYVETSWDDLEGKKVVYARKTKVAGGLL